jgi:hypothetical protein
MACVVRQACRAGCDSPKSFKQKKKIQRNKLWPKEKIKWAARDKDNFWKRDVNTISFKNSRDSNYKMTITLWHKNG